MALLDKNGVKLEVGQSVKMLFPGTSDECVGKVVGVDINHVNIEVVYYGAKQSVSVNCADLESVRSERVARFETELLNARRDLDTANARVKADLLGVDEATKTLAAAKGSLVDSRDAVKESTKRVADMQQGLETARKEADDEAAKNAELAGDPAHRETVGLQAMTAPIIPPPAAETTGDPAGA